MLTKFISHKIPNNIAAMKSHMKKDITADQINNCANANAKIENLCTKVQKIIDCMFKL